MAAIEGRVNRLLHGAQQHRMDLLRIGPVFGGHGDFLEITRLRFVANRHPQANRLEVVAQHVFFLRRRAFMYAEQANVFAT